MVIAALLSFNVRSQNKVDGISFIWPTDGKEPAQIRICKSGVRFQGEIIPLKNSTENGNERLDNNNPDKEKRSNPVIEPVML